jgi:hypothetical protein
VSKPLEQQIRDYFADCDEQQPVVDVAAVRSRIVDREVTLVGVADGDEPDGRMRGWLVGGLAVAATVVLVVAGVAWLSGSDGEIRQIDEPAVTTVAPTTTTGPPDAVSATVGVLGPGAWSVAATFTDAVSEEMVAGASEELRAWPGVLEVAIARDEAAWLELTGLDAGECGVDEGGPPCGVGLVALVATPQMSATQVRLESEFDVVAITAIDVPVAFVDGYFATVRQQPAPDLRFDATSLGTELPLEVSDESAGLTCSIPEFSCLTGVLFSDDGVAVRASLVRYEDDFSIDVGVLGENSSSGVGLEVTDLLLDGSGQGGVVTYLDGAAGDRRVYVLAGLPADAAAVTFRLDDGARRSSGDR